MMKGLKFFTRTSGKGSWNIASWHSPHSLTWRWLLGFSRFGGDVRRVWPIWMPHRTNNGLQWTIRVPFVGFLRFSQQRPMWYRNLYMRLRDERDGLNNCPPPHTLPPPSIVMDGSRSVH